MVQHGQSTDEAARAVFDACESRGYRVTDYGMFCGFRSNPITDSGASRSLIPIQPDH